MSWQRRFVLGRRLNSHTERANGGVARDHHRAYDNSNGKKVLAQLLHLDLDHRIVFLAKNKSPLRQSCGRCSTNPITPRPVTGPSSPRHSSAPISSAPSL